MNIGDDEILDYKPKKVRRSKFLLLYVLAIILFLYWFISEKVNAPYRELALAAGLILLAIITILQFILIPQKTLGAISIFAGKLLFLVAILFVFIKLPYSSIMICAAGAAFLLGVLKK